MRSGKKIHNIIFILAMMAVLVIPSVGMIFHPTTVSYENRELKELPKVRMTAADSPGGA